MVNIEELEKIRRFADREVAILRAAREKLLEADTTEPTAIYHVAEQISNDFRGDENEHNGYNNGEYTKPKNPNSPATDNQKNALKNMGVDVPDNLTMGEADALFKNSPASESQKNTLRGIGKKMGFTVPDNLTREQASELFKKYPRPKTASY